MCFRGIVKSSDGKEFQCDSCGFDHIWVLLKRIQGLFFVLTETLQNGGTLLKKR